MNCNRCKHDEDVTLVSDPERILHDGRRAAAASGTATPAGSPPITPKSLEAALAEVATPIWRADGEDPFDGLTYKPVSEDCPSWRIRPTHSASSAQLEHTVREQIASISALVEDDVVHLFEDAVRGTELCPNMKVISVIQPVVNRALAKGFRSAAFYSAVEGAIRKCASEPPCVYEVGAKVVDAPCFTVPVARFVKHEVKKNSLDKARMEERFVWLIEAVEEKIIKVEDGIPTKRINTARSRSPSKDISDGRGINPKSYRGYTSSDESDIRRRDLHRRERKKRCYRTRRHHRSSMPQTYMRSNQSGVNVLVPVNEGYQKTVDYRSYRPIHKSQRSDDDVALEIQKMRKKVAIQVRDQAFNVKDTISVINFLTEFKRACDSSDIHEGATVWLLREFMNGPALAAIKGWLTLSSNDANKHEETSTTYAEVVSHLPRLYATFAVVEKADEKFRNFKQGSLTPWDFSEKLWDLTLSCGGIYNEQTLRGCFVEGTGLNICSTMRRWWAANRKAVLKDLAHQARSLLDLQRGQRISATRQKQTWEKIVRKTKRPKGSSTPRCIKTVDDSGRLSTSRENSRSQTKSWAQVVSPVASAPSNNADESDSRYMDSGTYCRAYYRSNNVISMCSHLKQDTQFVKTRNRNYDAGSGTKADHRKPVQYSAGHHSSPPQARYGPQRKFISRSPNWRNTLFTPRHGPALNRFYSNPRTERSENIAIRYGPRPSNSDIQLEH